MSSGTNFVPVVFLGVGLFVTPLQAADEVPPGSTTQQPGGPDTSQTRSPKKSGLDIQKKEGGPLLAKKMKFQVRTQGGDFETWETEIVIPDLSIPVSVRWGKPLLAGPAIIQIATDPMFVQGSVIWTKQVESNSEGPDAWWQTELKLKGVLPFAPPQDTKKYYARLILKDVPALMGTTNRITIAYKKGGDATEFPIGAFYPQMFQPMPTFVDIDRLIIHKADEDDDEEPFFIPIVIYFDDTQMVLPDLVNSSIRVFWHTGQPHGNVPQYNNALGPGQSVVISNQVGRFEQSIVPLFFTQPQSMINVYSKLFLQGVTEDQLMKATNIFVIVLAFEQDGTSDEAAAAARDVVVTWFSGELNRCFQEMDLPDLQNLANNGGSLQSTLTDPNASLCGYTASEDHTILHQLVQKLTGLGEEAAKSEEMNDAIKWFPHNLQLLDNADHDDYIGFNWRVFSYNQIARASAPISFSMNFEKSWTPLLEAGATQVHYEIQGQVGRCAGSGETSSAGCTPAFSPYIE